MDGWQTRPLGDVCERVTVGHVGITAEHYRDDGVLFLRTQNVGELGLDLTDRKYITAEFHAKLRKSEVKAGDILMSRVITHTVRCAMADEALGPANCANVVLVRPGAGLAGDFLLHYIRSPQAQRYLLSRKVGSAQLVVNTSVVRGWPVPLPSLLEQRRIAAILDEAFEAITTAKANAEKNLRNAQDLFDSRLRHLVSKQAAGWDRKTLREVAVDFGRGKSKHRPRNDPKLYGGPYPFIQTGDVRGSDHLITEYTQTYSEAGLAQSKLWPKGTLCITIAANIAETGVLGFDACFPDSVIGVVVDERQTSSKYLEYMLQTVKAELKAKGKGSAQDNINLATFENERFPFPDLTTQASIVTALDALAAEVQRLESIYTAKLAALDELKQSLLNQAFTGALTALSADQALAPVA